MKIPGHQSPGAKCEGSAAACANSGIVTALNV